MTPVVPQGFQPKSVKNGWEDVYEVHKGDYQCLIISLGLKTDHFDQKCTFLSKSATEMTPVVPSDSDQKVKVLSNGQEDVYDVHKRDC